MTPPRALSRDVVERPWISTQPLGLAYVAARLRQEGFRVEVIDGYSLGMSAAAVREAIAASRPDIFGVSSLTPQWPDAAALAAIAREVDPGLTVVVGGPHVTALPLEAVATAGVDIAVIGEGEEAMVELCRVVADGGRFEDVAGIVISRDGQGVATAARERNYDLDRIPFPAHALLPGTEFYNPFPSWGKGGNYSSMISGRGCPYDCSFCDVTAQQGKRYRLRSARNIVDELTWLKQTYAIKTFSFRDPSVVCKRSRLLEMCRLMDQRGLDMAWTCSARANEVDREMLTVMKQAGCRLVQYGIEVGNPGLLQKIKKVTREQVVAAVRDTRLAGLAAHGYFLFGFVDETPENIEETIAFALELDLDSAGFGLMVPFPGTAEFERYEQEGRLLTRDWGDYDVLGKPVYNHGRISYEQLASAPRRAYRRFYLRPRIIARYARMVTSPRVIRNYARSARLMLR